MRIMLLGQIGVVIGDRRYTVPRGQSRAVLALLGLHAGRPLSHDVITEALWAGQPPSSGRAQIHGAIYTIRRLGAAHGVPDIILSGRYGYQLAVAPEQVDVGCFQHLVEQARQARAAGDHTAAADLLRGALNLWTGEPLTDATGAFVTSVRADLDERRIRAVNDLTDSQIQLGHHDEAITELKPLLAAFPLREDLRARLMLALHSRGRRAEALALYRSYRRLLADQEGLDPGADLTAVHQAILRDNQPRNGDHRSPDHPLTPATPRPPAGPEMLAGITPTTLPADIGGFAGREEALTRLDSLAEDAAGRLVVIDGSAGLGKTALAVHWGHRARHRFPDGQLYVNLRGHAPGGPLTPLQALSLLLSSLGVASVSIPLEADAAAGLYRSLIADRRVLVVLDDALSAAQVRPLLPGGPSSLTLVTSRVRLDGLVALDGARRIALDVLSPSESVRLLNSVLGTHRVAAEEHATAELAGLCAHLPLALRIAAARIAADAHRTIAGQAAELRQRDRLSALQIPGDADVAMRAAFDVSYTGLPAECRVLFRLFGLAPRPELAVDGLAALAGTAAAELTAPLAELVRHHLVYEATPGRYTLHDLLGLYAAERAAAEQPPGDRQAAQSRLLDYYLTGATVAGGLAYPQLVRWRADVPAPTGHFDTAADAAAWLDAERANLLASARHAGDHGHPAAYAWQLADVLRGYFLTCRHDADWLTIGGYAVDAADATGDVSGQAVAALSLGMACRSVGRYDEAITYLTRAARAAGRAGWPAGRAYALTQLGWTQHDAGQLQAGIRHLRQAVAASREAGSGGAEASARNGLAVLRRANGHIRETVAEFTEVLAIMEATGSVAGQAAVHANFAISHYQLGNHDDARRHLATALAIYRRNGERYGSTLVLMVLAEVHSHRQRHRLARTLASAALRSARQIGDKPSQAMALAISAEVDRAAGRPQEALAHSTEALALAGAVANLEARIHALIGLGSAQRDLGRHELALGNLTEALSVAQRCGYRLYVGIALTALADLHLRCGDHVAAAEHAARALASHRRTGYRVGAAEARQVAALVRQRPPSPASTAPPASSTSTATPDGHKARVFAAQTVGRQGLEP